ncbi:MAG: mechanosensitive ion channel family protein [Chloroflexi bacterium]|nr:mechanosensitive ion channel family protein [Chloroflexota bacterium]
MKQPRQISALLAGAAVAIPVVGLLVAMLFVPSLSIYVTIIAIGLALALQKYVGSFVGYFLIRFGKFFAVGDRVRINGVKGDVRHMGLFHFILDEVGEDEKLGGELTGRILHMPNLMVLDQPILNFCQDYSVKNVLVNCEYVFDEIRIPLRVDSNLRKAKELLRGIIVRLDREHIEGAKAAFWDNCPNFLNEAEQAPRVLSHVEPGRIWLKGKFVSPVRLRNELKSVILDEFVESATRENDIHLA